MIPGEGEPTKTVRLFFPSDSLVLYGLTTNHSAVPWFFAGSTLEAGFFEYMRRQLRFSKNILEVQTLLEHT